MNNFKARERKTKSFALILTIAIHLVLIGGIAVSSGGDFGQKISDLVQSWTSSDEEAVAEAKLNKS